MPIQHSPNLRSYAFPGTQPVAQPSPDAGVGPAPASLQMPTSADEMRGLIDTAWSLHPRNAEQTMTASEQAEDAAAAESGAGAAERPWWTEKPVQASIFAGFGKNAVDVARLVKKYPEALRTGNLATAIQQTLLTAPDSRIIDPALKGAKVAGDAVKTFDRFDDYAMRISSGLAAPMSFIQFASAFPSLGNSLFGEDGGVDNLVNTAQGRAGVLQLAGGSLGLYMLNQARIQTAGQGANLLGRLAAIGSAPAMANPMLTKIGLVSGLSVTLNELGYLDVLNADDDRSAGQKLGDAVHRTPLLNSDWGRTLLPTVVGGLAGYNAAKAMTAAPAGASLLEKVGSTSLGQKLGVGVGAAMLGAQLLGGLDFMNS